MMPQINMDTYIDDRLYQQRIKLKDWEFDLARTPEMVRMENVCQLGLTRLTIPSATNTRYEHSIGVAYLADLLLDHLGTTSKPQVKKELESHRNLLRAAAILHDCGHTPYSHTLNGLVEMLFGKSHETLSAEIVKSSPRIKKILKKGNVNVEDVVTILKPREEFHIPYIQEIISGDTDVDRIDYLNRDAFYTKKAYGVIDHRSLIESMNIREIEPEDYDRTVKAFEKNLINKENKQKILSQITKLDKNLGDSVEKLLEQIQKKPAEILKERHIVLDFEKRHAAIGLLMTREVMYPLVYRHPTTRAYESVFTKVVEYCIQNNLVNPSSLYDADEIVKLCTSGRLINDGLLDSQLRSQEDKYVKEMLKSIDTRKPMPEAFRASFLDLRDIKPTIKEIAYASDSIKKYHLIKGLGESIASEIGIDYWHVFIDIYSIKEEKGLVNALVYLPDHRIISLSEASSIVHGLKNSPIENWEAVVRLPEKVNNKELAYNQSIRRKIRRIFTTE